MEKDTIHSHIQLAVRELVRSNELLYEQIPALSSSLHWHALAMLQQYTILNSQQLADLLHIDKIFTTRLVTQLVEQGVCVIKADKLDGRHKLLSLTEKGQATLQKMNQLTHAHIQPALDSIAEEKHHALAELLSTYTKALKLARLQQECTFHKSRQNKMSSIAHFVKLVRAEAGYDETNPIVQQAVRELSQLRTFSRTMAYLTITRNKKIVGAVGYSHLAEQGSCMVWGLYLSLPLRGVGLGTTLMHNLFEELQSNNFKQCYVEVTAEYVPFYTKLGFKPTTDIPTELLPSTAPWYKKELVLL